MDDKTQAAKAIIDATGGIEAHIRSVESQATNRALELLVLNEMSERAPLPRDAAGGESEVDTDTALVRRVCGKLKCELRYLGDIECGCDQKTAHLLRAVKKLCRLTTLERGDRYSTRRPASADPTDLDQLGADRRLYEGSPEGRMPDWWAAVSDQVPTRLARLASLFSLYIENLDDVDQLLNTRGKLDLEGICSNLGCTRREVQEILSAWRRDIARVKVMVPRAFRRVHRQLSTLATMPLGGLADVELRERLFGISRDLAFTFGPEDLIARGVRKLAKPDFDVATDLLLDEHKAVESSDQRPILERLMGTMVRVCDALEAGQVDRAFAHSSLLVLDAARIQPHTSPARLQVLLSYSYFLWLGGWHDACLQALQAVVDRCNAIARQKGEAALDQPAEFENGDSLRRIRTYAGVNQVSCLFYHTYSTARQERFAVKDYDGLVSLVSRLKGLLEDDPQATTVHDELLVVLAHLVRAAYNRRTAKDKSAKDHWKDERARWRAALGELIESRFLTSDVPKLNARAIVESVQATAEGCAVERTLDVVEEVLHDLPGLVREIRTERQAALGLPIPS